MGVFSAIKNAIFGHPAAGQAAPQPAPVDATTAPAQARAVPTLTEAATSAAPVDVEGVLNEISADKGHPDLNWKSSIVDLMKLLSIDSSLSNREELATELGYTGDKNGSAEMNIWLHKAVMKALADNGGRVPANMMD